MNLSINNLGLFKIKMPNYVPVFVGIKHKRKLLRNYVHHEMMMMMMMMMMKRKFV